MQTSQMLRVRRASRVSKTARELAPCCDVAVGDFAHPAPKNGAYSIASRASAQAADGRAAAAPSGEMKSPRRIAS
jgi:hypothetical protein